MSTETLGDVLKHKRIHNDYSLGKLAKLAGVSKTYLWQLEKGDSSPTIDILQRLADALEISVTDFFVTPPTSGGTQDDISNFPGSIVQKIINMFTKLSDNQKKRFAIRIKNAFDDAIEDYAYGEWRSELKTLILGKPGVPDVVEAITTTQPHIHQSPFNKRQFSRALECFINGRDNYNLFIEELQIIEEVNIDSIKSLAAQAIAGFAEALNYTGNPFVSGTINVYLARLYCKVDYEIAYHYYKTAITTFDTSDIFLKDFERVALLTELGSVAYRIRRKSKAMKAFSDAIEIIEYSEQTPDAFTLSAYRGLGGIYDHCGDFDKAIDLIEQGLHKSQSLGHSRETAWCYYRKIVVNQNRGKDVYDELQDLKSHVINQDSGYHDLNLLAQINNRLTFYERDEHIFQAAENALRSSWELGQAFVDMHSGWSHLINKNDDNATRDLHLALDNFNELRVTYQHTICYTLLTEAQINRGLTKTAKLFANRAASFAQRNDETNEYQQAIAHVANAICYAKTDYEKATDFLNLALVIFDRHNVNSGYFYEKALQLHNSMSKEAKS